MFFIPVRTVRATGFVTGVLGGATLGDVVGGTLAATRCEAAVSGGVCRGTVTTACGRAVSGKGAGGVTALIAGGAVSGEGCSCDPKYRLRVSGIVNSKPYLRTLDPRD